MDKLNSQSATDASVRSNGNADDALEAKGRYVAQCFDKDGNLKWEDHFDNLVTTAGKNGLLDAYLAGSNYTATWYMGLISSVGYGAGPAVTDTMSSHAGWTEAGPNAPNLQNTSRPACVWANAAAGVKALSTALTFTFSGPGTIKGSFICANSLLGGTSALLLSAGVFSGGDRTVAANDVVTVNYQLSV